MRGCLVWLVLTDKYDNSFLYWIIGLVFTRRGHEEPTLLMIHTLNWDSLPLAAQGPGAHPICQEPESSQLLNRPSALDLAKMLAT